MPSSRLSNVFDYIVVGAGSAGCVLASQLAKIGGVRVLLIEQGSRYWHRHSHVPVRYPKLFSDTSITHGYETVPQPALAGRRISLPAGKGLGGSSLINAMIYVRPHDRDIDAWEQICGSRSHSDASTKGGIQWNRRVLLRHLEQIESRYGLNAQNAYPEVSPSMRKILDKVSDAGFPFIAPYARTQFRGRRLTSWNTWTLNGRSWPESRLRSESSGEMVGRDGLEWLKGATVERVLFSGERAIGVRLGDRPQGAGAIEVRARHGVILSAGAIGTPKLLMQSGIGPKEHIKGKVECVFDSENVGRQLHDHLVFPIVMRSSMDPLPRDFGKEDRANWLENGCGPMASNIAELGAFLVRDTKGCIEFAPHWTTFPSKETPSATSSHAETEHLAQPDEQPRAARPIAQWHITPTHYLEYPFRNPATMAHSVAVTWLHPASRGELRWGKERNWGIDPSYHSHLEDAAGLVEAIQWTRRWINNGPLNTLFADEILPGAKRSGDEQVHAVVSRLCNTLYHYSGSCAMGAESNAVCDPQMQVRGVDGLFVCDASVIPVTLSGNTQATVMMLGLQLANELAKR